jgi:hypothetical protein
VKSAVKPPNAGKGRVKGTPNKTTALLKDAILKAAEGAGGGKNGLVVYLQRQADENPGPFLALLGKVLPLQLTGANGGPIEIRASKEQRDAAVRAALATSKP